ncbi:winged helix-turn-helix domain-containing protein [Enterococcus sp. AZ126]|uniref:winged helix-turn-helix domain-containing protein n=1 Tax=Enterococcus sp. AZ126 TaxID=2774635 RepID=UPI003F25D1D8
MYKVAIISSEDYSLDGYAQAFAQEQCKIVFLNIEAVEVEEIQGMDAIIIEEMSSENIGRTCELIIKMKNYTTGMIWIVSKNSKKNNRIIYLQLGASATVDTRIEPDEFSLLIRKSFDRVYTKSEATFIDRHMNKPIEDSKTEKPEVELLSNVMGVKIAGQKEILLTRLEYKVLVVLNEQLNQVVPYAELFQRVWGGESDLDTFRLANLISHLRRKIEGDPEKPKYIKTIRSKGYMLSV